MPTWMVQLEGHAFDLTAVESLFDGPECTVVKGDDHYYLQSARFELLTDATDVRQLADELISRMNGAAKLQSSTARPITCAGVIIQHISEGITAINVFPPPAVIRSVASIASIDGPGVAIPLPRPPTDPAIWIAKSDQDPTAAKALRIFGSEHTWDNLYRVLDAIEADVGGEKALRSKGWTSATDLRRFTATANNARVLGDAARHSHDRWEPPKNPMSLEEATMLIRGLVQSWLASK